jgi:hypothetical protein
MVAMASAAIEIDEQPPSFADGAAVVGEWIDRTGDIAQSRDRPNRSTNRRRRIALPNIAWRRVARGRPAYYGRHEQ